MSPPPPHIQDQLGGEKRWMMGARCTFTHPTTSCLVTGCLFLSLTTPPFHLSQPRPPPPPPLLHHLHPTAPPFSGGSGSPSAALSTPPPSRSFVFFLFFCSGRGPLSVVVLLHACPVFLHVSSPPAAAIQRRWRRRCWWWWWWCSVSLPSSLLFASSLLCSVNPHCLVVMFELT